MKLENIETAISFGEKRKLLLEFKKILDDWFSSSTIKVVANTEAESSRRKLATTRLRQASVCCLKEA